MPSQNLQKNILVTNAVPPRACLAEFGLSTFVHDAQEAIDSITAESIPVSITGIAPVFLAGITPVFIAGSTPVFTAPELLFPEKFNGWSTRPTRPADIYAFGMVIYEVLTGSQPFHEQEWAAHKAIYHVIIGARPTKPTDVEQIGFGDGTWELLEKCWIEESTRRPTIDQVLKHLTCVAAYSKIVDPTPHKPREGAVNSPVSNSSSKLFISPSSTTLTSVHKVCFLAPMRRLATMR